MDGTAVAKKAWHRDAKKLTLKMSSMTLRDDDSECTSCGATCSVVCLAFEGDLILFASAYQTGKN